MSAPASRRSSAACRRTRTATKRRRRQRRRHTSPAPHAHPVDARLPATLFRKTDSVAAGTAARAYNRAMVKELDPRTATLEEVAQASRSLRRATTTSLAVGAVVAVLAFMYL